MHEKDVNLSFVLFDLAVRFPMDQQEGLVGEIYKLFHGKMMGVGRCLRSETLPDAPQVGGGPVLEALRGGLLRHGSLEYWSSL